MAAKRGTVATPEPTRDAIEIPPFEITEARHPKAVCRWCGSHFMPVWQDELSKAWQWICPTPACYTRQLEGAMRHPTRARYAYVPTPAGVELMFSRFPKLMWGGAAQGAKSHGLRWYIHYWCQRIPGLECLLMRRSFPELQNTHLTKMIREQDMLDGARYIGGNERTMHYETTGSFCRAGHCESASDISKILSTEYDIVGIDEAVTFQEDILSELFTRARTVKPIVKDLMGDAQARPVTNPGGIGHAYLKSAFIDHDLDRDDYPDYDPSHWSFIPASLHDNPYGDPNYENTLKQMKKERRDQLLSGNWNVYVGQFFPMFSDAHVIG